MTHGLVVTLFKKCVLFYLSVFSFLALTGCHAGNDTLAYTPTPTNPPGPESPNWPEKLADFRFRWSAEPSVDLETGKVVPLRAYLESMLVNSYTGNPSGGYPGFQRATPQPIDQGAPDWASTPESQKRIRGPMGADYAPELRLFGNEELYVLDIEATEVGFRAFVCDATFNVYKRNTDSKQLIPLNFESSTYTAPNNPDYHNMRVWRTEFSDHDPRVGSAPPPSPSAAQRGPLPAPRTDVFGAWFVTGSEWVAMWSDHDYPGLKPGSPESRQRAAEARSREDAMRQQCLERYPLNAAERAQRATTVLVDPPRVEAAVPGWPA